MTISEEDIRKYFEDSIEVSIEINPETFQPMINMRAQWTIETVQDFQAGLQKSFESILVDVIKSKVSLESILVDVIKSKVRIASNEMSP
jgi:hypothetical protein